MRARKYLHALLCCLLVPLPFLFPMIGNLPSAGEFPRMEQYFVLNFMGFPAQGLDPSLLYFVLTQLVPEIALFYLLSGTFLSDYETNAVYVFTRIGNKQRWLRQKALELFCQVCAAVLFTFLVTALFGTAAGYRFSGQGAPVYLRLLLFQILPAFVLLFIQNFASLSLGRTQSFLLLVVFYAGSILLGGLFFNQTPIGNLLIALLPPSSQMYAWHAGSPNVVGIPGTPLAGFTAVFSAVWMAVCFAAAYAVSSVILQKKDLIALVKGDAA